MDIEKLYDNGFLQQLSKKEADSHKKLVKKIKKQKPKQFDYIMQSYHDEVFDQIDCLKCGNCCKGLGPRVLPKDIERLAKSTKTKEIDFISTHLRVDEDNDYVFKEMPCPFLDNDNYCFVYSDRPKACRDFPHTNHSKMLKHISLSIKNSSICPAVYYILEKLKSDFM